MNAAASTNMGTPSAASARTAPTAASRHDDEVPPPAAEAGAAAAQPPLPLFGAWQAALLAREPAPGAVGMVAEPSATEHTLASARTGGHAPPDVGPLATAQDSAAWRVEATFQPGAGPAWQLALQRGPEAAAWSLQLATPTVPPAWGATQLPRLERRLREQGHVVERLDWQAAATPARGRHAGDEPWEETA